MLIISIIITSSMPSRKSVAAHKPARQSVPITSPNRAKSGSFRLFGEASASGIIGAKLNTV